MFFVIDIYCDFGLNFRYYLNVYFVVRRKKVKRIWENESMREGEGGRKGGRVRERKKERKKGKKEGGREEGRKIREDDDDNDDKEVLDKFKN